MVTKTDKCEAMILGIIRERDLQPGQALPPEAELAEKAKVSRGAVRAALKRLRDRGLVVSKQGSGTVMADPSTTAAATSAPSRAVDAGPRFEPLEVPDEAALDDGSSLATLARTTLGLGIGETAAFVACRIRAPRKDDQVGLRLTFHAAERIKPAEGGADALYAAVLGALGARSGDVRGKVIAIAAEDAKRHAGDMARHLAKLKGALLMIDEVLVTVGGASAGRPCAFSRVFLGGMQAVDLARAVRA